MNRNTANNQGDDNGKGKKRYRDYLDLGSPTFLQNNLKTPQSPSGPNIERKINRGYCGSAPFSPYFPNANYQTLNNSNNGYSSGYATSLFNHPTIKFVTSQRFGKLTNVGRRETTNLIQNNQENKQDEDEYDSCSSSCYTGRSSEESSEESSESSNEEKTDLAHYCSVVVTEGMEVPSELDGNIPPKYINWQKVSTKLQISKEKCTQIWKDNFSTHKLARLPFGLVLYCEKSFKNDRSKSSGRDSSDHYEPAGNAQTNSNNNTNSGTGTGTGSNSGT